MKSKDDKNEDGSDQEREYLQLIFNQIYYLINYKYVRNTMRTIDKHRKHKSSTYII